VCTACCRLEVIGYDVAVNNSGSTGNTTVTIGKCTDVLIRVITHSVKSGAEVSWAVTDDGHNGPWFHKAKGVRSVPCVRSAPYCRCSLRNADGLPISQGVISAPCSLGSADGRRSHKVIISAPWSLGRVDGMLVTPGACLVDTQAVGTHEYTSCMFDNNYTIAR
jgi:hypothetical protein